MKEGLFSFWKKIDQKLAELGPEIEDKVYSDPHAVLIKARMFAENLTKLVNEKENIQEVYDVKQNERIRKLLRNGFIVEEVYERFDWLRKMGNEAAHEPSTVKIESSLQAHRYLYDITVWYMEVYGDLGFKPPKYELPQVNTNPTINTSEIESVIEESVGKMLGDKFDSMMELVKQQLTNVNKEVAATTSVQQDAEVQKIEKAAKPVNQKIALPDYLTQLGYEVIDKRSKKGAFWVIGGWELNKVLFPLKEEKIYFRFSKKGGKATKNRPAWFLLNKTTDELFIQKKDDSTELEEVVVEESKEPVKNNKEVKVFNRVDSIEYSPLNDTELHVPVHLLNVTTYKGSLKIFLENYKADSLQDITLNNLRDYYKSSRDEFFNVLLHLALFGVQINGSLAKLTSYQMNPEEGFLVVNRLEKDMFHDIFPAHFRSILSKFGISVLSDLHHFPISSLKWLFKDYEDELLLILDKCVEHVVEEDNVPTIETVIEEEVVEGKKLLCKQEVLVIPLAKLDKPLKIEDFPGCNHLVRQLQEHNYQTIGQLPDVLDGIHTQFQGVGPGAVKKFWDLLKEVVKESEIEEVERPQGTGVSFQGEVLEFSEDFQKQTISGAYLQSFQPLLNYFSSKGIKTYGELPYNLIELNEAPRVGNARVEKFFYALKSEAQNFEERHAYIQELNDMTEEEKCVFFFNQFVERIETIISDDEQKKLHKIQDRWIDIITKRYEESLKGSHLTLEELGQTYNLTRERVRQIIRKMLERLSHSGADWIKIITEQVNRTKVIKNDYLDSNIFSHYIIKECLLLHDVRLIHEDKLLTNLSREQLIEIEQMVQKRLQDEWKGKLVTAEEVKEFIQSCDCPPIIAEHEVNSRLMKYREFFILSESTKADLAGIVLQDYPNGAEVYKNADELCERGNSIIPGTFNSHRDFAAIIGRDEFEDAYLWGRGTYIHKKFVQIPYELLSTISTYIESWIEERGYLTVGRVYQQYENELLTAKVPTEYALYELLRKHSPIEGISFNKYPRITRADEDFKYNGERIIDYIRRRGVSVSTADIYHEFVETIGWKPFTLQLNLSQLEEVIPDSHQSYTLLEFFNDISKESLLAISEKLGKKMKQIPFVQIRGLYAENESYCKGLGIYSAYVLYYLLKKHFHEDYVFPRFPHILAHGAEEDNPTMKSIVEGYLLDQNREVSREELVDWLVQDVGGRINTADLVISSSDQIFYYTRGQFGEYVHSEVIGWNEEKAEQVRKVIKHSLIKQENKPYVLSSMIDLDLLPELKNDLPWTEDLLIDCVRRDDLFQTLGSMHRIFTLKEQQELNSNTDFLVYILREEFNGAAKINEIGKVLQQNHYTSDGDILAETWKEIEDNKTSIKLVGDEMISTSLLGTED
ncbi:sigma factor-like helix-turn-helix DNA-binding protein [Gracilibacillus sp. S3-1-1]|uniref:Sigma factor-like helix-turn-helix DNA-binding protein n=1 Tax=Gracilibacillus pellucidus TaxID=3095368 RepID=A0ACC6M8U8_9BACI|nr:sigma factor-like helix-turn-helix DNA-binding protein [Gracilibacillus sp. S3-1-1]MDX8047291.1 sigma factor-like helix-turn-helix DNA-binding protein [Gracilibacillus sp. S3-1-1]